MPITKTQSKELFYGNIIKKSAESEVIEQLYQELIRGSQFVFPTAKDGFAQKRNGGMPHLGIKG